MRQTLKEHNPDVTRYEEMFLDVYFDFLTTLMLRSRDDEGDWERATEKEKLIGIDLVVARDPTL